MLKLVLVPFVLALTCAVVQTAIAGRFAARTGEGSDESVHKKLAAVVVLCAVCAVSVLELVVWALGERQWTALRYAHLLFDGVWGALLILLLLRLLWHYPRPAHQVIAYSFLIDSVLVLISGGVLFYRI
ncbi:MAG: hypothetical protein KGI70_00770 [Patescibacteria group bacterium]|nr:hypothetical protein [Patescibacteria group bacterium]